MDGVTVFCKKMLNGRHTPNGPTAADKRSVLAKLRRDTAGCCMRCEPPAPRVKA